MDEYVTDELVLRSGSDCGSVGRAASSDTRVLRFESRHSQILLPVKCIETTEIKKKMAGNGLSKKLGQGCRLLLSKTIDFYC